LRFSAPVRTGPGAHPASCTMVTGSLSWVQSGWGMALNTHAPSSAEFKERVELYFYSSSGTYVACSRVNFPLVSHYLYTYASVLAVT